MAYHYGDGPASNPITATSDLTYMEGRWETLAARCRRLVVEGSAVSYTTDQETSLGIASAWRYDIGKNRIEALFAFPEQATVFIKHGAWTVIEDSPAPVDWEAEAA